MMDLQLFNNLKVASPHFFTAARFCPHPGFLRGGEKNHGPRKRSANVHSKTGRFDCLGGNSGHHLRQGLRGGNEIPSHPSC